MFSQSKLMVERYSKTSLTLITQDIHFLSACDYVVCTFSSNVSKQTMETV